MAAAETSFPRLDDARDVLIVKPSSLGDIAHALPAVAWLKHAWPHLRLHWVANAEWTPVLQGSSLLESVIPFPRNDFRGRGGWRLARRWYRDFGAAWEGRCEVALDFQGLLRSALLARRSGAPVVAGLSDAREGSRWLHTHSVPVTRGMHAVQRNLALVRAFGPPIDERAALAGDWLPAGETVASTPTEPFLLLHPFSRGRDKSLGWADVRKLVVRWWDHPVVIVGRSDDPAPALPSNALNLVNATTLSQLIGLMRRARFVVSVDSGPMHLASALHRPLLGLHTWSDPRRVGPYDDDAWIWKAGQITRRRQVDEALATHTLPLDPMALDAIAEWVTEQLLK